MPTESPPSLRPSAEVSRFAREDSSFVKKPEISERETRSNRAADERVLAERSGGLPSIRGDGVYGSAVQSHRGESVPLEIAKLRVHLEQLERAALVQMPNLV